MGYVRPAESVQLVNVVNDIEVPLEKSFVLVLERSHLEKQTSLLFAMRRWLGIVKDPFPYHVEKVPTERDIGGTINKGSQDADEMAPLILQVGDSVSDDVQYRDDEAIS